jgi:hypothetical protein
LLTIAGNNARKEKSESYAMPPVKATRRSTTQPMGVSPKVSGEPPFVSPKVIGELPFVVPEKYRFSIELPASLGIKLEKMCSLQQATKTDLVRRSLNLLFKLHEKQADGFEMVIEKKEGRKVLQFELDLGI